MTLYPIIILATALLRLLSGARAVSLPATPALPPLPAVADTVAMDGRSTAPVATPPLAPSPVAPSPVTTPPVSTSFIAPSTTPDTVYMGLIRTGTCDSVTIPIDNDLAIPLTADSILLDGTHKTLFTVADPASGVIDSIGAGNAGHVRVRFCPGEDGCFRAELSLVTRPIDGSSPPVRTRIGIGGCAGTPRMIVDRTKIDFGTVRVGGCEEEQITISNVGTYPLIIPKLSTKRSGYTIIPNDPFTLLPGEHRVITIHFCPPAAGAFDDSLTIAGNVSSAPIPIAGSGRVQLGVMNDILHFGTVPVGNCRDTTLSIGNGGSDTLTIRGARLTSPPDDPAFLILTSFDLGGTLRIPPGGTGRISLRFCPEKPGQSINVLELNADPDSNRFVTLIGDGFSARLWLDTASGNVGDVVTLHARLDSSTARAARIGSYSMRLTYEPTALFPISATTSPGAIVTMTHVAYGQLSIDGNHGGGELEGSELFAIDFRGLSTGRPLNRVRIADVTFNTPDTTTVTGDGLVLLSGCDLDTSIRVGAKLAVRSVRNDGEGPGLEVLYQAPQYREVWVEMFDLAGHILYSRDLPIGTAAEQRAYIPTGAFNTGPYLIALRTATDRAVATVFIAN